MTQFEYVSVAISIVFSFAVLRLLDVLPHTVGRALVALLVVPDLRQPSGAILALTLAPLCFACRGVPLYDGPRLSRDEVAVVVTSRSAAIVELDGRTVKGSKFELLPGPHSLRFTAYRRLPNELIARELSAECRATLEMAAGRVYETRAEFERESLGTEKAPGGVVTRHHLRLAVLDEGSEIAPADLECSDRNACMVFWRHGSGVSSATCARYDQPGFAFRGPDDRKRTFRNGVEGELLAGYGTYCSDLDDAEVIRCYIEASAEALIVDLDEGTSLLFVPEDPASVGAEERDAAMAACTGTKQFDPLRSCLKGRGYVLFERP